MTDTVIKGTGNSRSIIIPPDAKSRYHSVDDILDAMIAGTFMVDIGPLNPAGCDVVGTANNKANLLSDATAALLAGLGSNPTVDKALAALAARDVLYTEYTGTSTDTSADKPMFLTFPYAPKLIMIPFVYYKSDSRYTFTPNSAGSSGSYTWMADMSTLTTEWQLNLGFNLGTGSFYGKKSPDGKTIYWYSNYTSGHNYEASLNSKYYIYRFIAIT